MAPEGEASVDKNKKYDRQLRLWGDHGQAALEAAKVCLINAGAIGTEILKNLILPGIGSFTVVDSHRVSGEDVGCNFFLTGDSIGKSRAQVTTELLNELNDDTHGDYLDESLEEVLEKNPEFFSAFTVVVATSVQESSLLHLAGLLWQHGTPLLVCQAYGLIGYLRLVVKDHAIIESHPDSEHYDLRLDRPFPALQALCATFDLNAMDYKSHSHTPWLIILYKFLELYREKHGHSPTTYKEKNELKDMIRDGIRLHENGVPEDEENFEEAIKSVNVALVRTQIPEEVQQIFADRRCVDLTADSSPFWVMARAVKDFVDNEGAGALPLRGNIPDMTSETEKYVALQRVYRDKAVADAATVARRAAELKQKLGLGPLQQQEFFTDDVKVFCKNAAFLRVVTCAPLPDEYEGRFVDAHKLALHLEGTDESDVAVFYVLLRAAERFYRQYNRYPGRYEDEAESDVPLLKTCVAKLLQDWGLLQTVKDEYIHEFCCYGAAEVHSVAAYIAGVAAQEVIKVITRQYVPLRNTLLYSAISQTTVTLNL